MIRGGFGPAVPPPPVRGLGPLGRDDAREILGSVPRSMLRSLQGTLLGVLLLALLVTWFVRYPDEIRAPVLLTSADVPSSVVARASGTLVLQVRDGEAVRAGEPLGYVEAAGSPADVLRLKDAVARFRAAPRGPAPPPFDAARFGGADLGALADAYAAFEQDLLALRLRAGQGGSAARQAEVERRIAGYRELIARSRAEAGLREEEIRLARSRYQADSALAAARLVAPLEAQERRRALLSLRREAEQAAAAETNLRLAAGQLRDDERRAREQEAVDARELERRVDVSAAQLWTQIGEWERLYVFRAGRDGRVALNRYWASHQYVQANDEVLSVVPPGGAAVLGFVRAPIARSGTLRVGQRVRISLADFPADAYGELEGAVAEVSPVARDSAYRVTVALPRGLTTTTGRTLPRRPEYRGTAQIATEDRRLLQRLLFRSAGR